MTAEAEVQADTEGLQGADWSSWDLSKTLRLLKDNKDEEVTKRMLRKLHTRMYHAGADRMWNLLRPGGCAPKIKELLKIVVDTCKICRMWTRPTPDNVVAGRLSTTFNEVVEFDLLFWRQILVFTSSTQRFAGQKL